MKINSYQIQLDDSIRNLEDMEKKYQAQKIYHEEAERVARQRALNNTKIVRPVNEVQNVPLLHTSSWFTSWFSRTKKGGVHIEKEGWLHHHGGITTRWQKQWFQLQESQLVFSNEKGDKEQNIIDLKDCLIQDAFETTNRPNSFVILTQNEQSYFLFAENVEEMDEWIIAINEKISILKRQSFDGLKSPPNNSPIKGETPTKLDNPEEQVRVRRNTLF